jgi:hypothetical protein
MRSHLVAFDLLRRRAVDFSRRLGELARGDSARAGAFAMVVERT